MKTKPLYLDDSYKKEMEATVTDVVDEGDGRYRLILDQTVFYPMGGGQPTDQGTLTSPTWKGDVYQVLMKEGEVWHFVNSSTAPNIGMNVRGTINWDRRYKNMRMHSAGHVVDFALYLLGHSPTNLVPTKGDHGKKPFIVYTGVIGINFKTELEDKANELISQKKEFSWSFVPFEELQKKALYLQPGLPTNKPLRMLTLEGVGSVADGGTQVKNTSEIGKITITSVEEKEGTTVVAYTIKHEI